MKINRITQRTSVVFVYGNHNNIYVLEDFFKLLEQPFLDIGVTIRYSNTILPGELNLLIEFFTPEFVRTAYKIKEQNPNTDFICLMTEEVTGDTLNNFKLKIKKMNIFKKNIQSFLEKFTIIKKVMFYFSNQNKDLYNNLSYWKDRYDNLVDLSSLVKEVWGLTPSQIDSYKTVFTHNNFRVIPTVAFSEKPLIEHPEDHLKDIDFLFSGTLTPYREKIIQALRSRNYNVYVAPSTCPWFLRENLLKRAKITLHMRPKNLWHTPSPMRQYTSIVMGSLLVGEKSEVSCFEERFTYSVLAKNFLNECEKQITAGSFAERGKKILKDYYQHQKLRREQMRSIVQLATSAPNV